MPALKDHGGVAEAGYVGADLARDPRVCGERRRDAVLEGGRRHEGEHLPCILPGGEAGVGDLFEVSKTSPGVVVLAYQ